MTDTEKINDRRFYHFIRKKTILSWIIKLTLPQFADLDIETIKNGLESDGKNTARMRNTVMKAEGSTAVTDSVFTFDAVIGGEHVSFIIGVEHQNKSHLKYMLDNREQYYAAKLLGEQVVDDNDYDTLTPSATIWLKPDPPARERGTMSMVTFWRTINGGEPVKVRNPLMNIVEVNLGADPPDDINIFDFLSPFFSLEGRTKSAEEFGTYQQRYNLTNEDVSLKEAREMCGIFADSKVRYTEEGRAEGIIEGKIEAICNLIMANKCTLDEAINLLKIPEEKVDYVRTEVQLRLSSPD